MVLHARPIRDRSLENPREIIRFVTIDRWLLYHGARRFDFVQFICVRSALVLWFDRAEKYALVKLYDENETTNRMTAFGHSS